MMQVLNCIHTGLKKSYICSTPQLCATLCWPISENANKIHCIYVTFFFKIRNKKRQGVWILLQGAEVISIVAMESFPRLCQIYECCIIDQLCLKPTYL